MNIIAAIKGLGTFKNAMEAGQMVADPAGWKNVSITTNRIAAICAAVLVVLQLANIKLPVSDETIVVISGGIATVLLGVNNILTTVTTRKIGKEPK